MSKILTLLLFPFSLFSQFSGEWNTSFVVVGQSMRMKMTIADSNEAQQLFIEDPDGTYPKIEMTEFTIEKDVLAFKWGKIGLSFDGTYILDGDSISGTMKQSGLEWDVNFTREEQVKKVVARPQEPKAPFDYEIQEVLIKNGKNVIGATITIPKNYNNETPIIVLTSGSGPQNRDCELLGHKPFWVIADYFASEEIITLRFDDRGIGKSTGSFSDATIFDFAEDVNACVSYLRKQFKNNKIGVAGHSEGGMHALVAASKNKNINFIIELASVGISGKEVLIDQQYDIPKKGGKSEAYCQWNKEVFSGLCDIIQKNKQEEAEGLITTFLSDKYDNSPQEYKDESDKSSFLVTMSMFINSDWARSFVNYNASDYLNKLRVPILTINGGEDIQVSPKKNYAAFKEHPYSENINGNAFYLVDGLNHLMQTCTECTILEYGELEETFSLEVMEIMKNWMYNNVR